MKSITARKQAPIAIIHGVTVSWRDTRHMVNAEPDDIEMIGTFQVRISAQDADLDAIANAHLCAQTLQVAAGYADMCCPHSDLRLRAVGLSEVGTVLLQIYRGDRKCDVIPVSDMSQMDPARYSNGGDEAMKSVAWMRDVAMAICAYHDALCGHGKPDLDAIHAAVYGTK